MIRLAIADDDPRFANNLKNELLEVPDIESIICFNSGFELIRELQLLPPDRQPEIVIMDISMRVSDEGIRATQELRKLFPHIAVVMFTISDDDDHIFEAFKAGATGYLLKDEKIAFIIQTLLEVKEGKALMSPSIAAKTIRFLTAPPAPKTDPGDYNLTEREIEILRHVSRGLTYQSIGEKLFISPETVKKHIANIYRKLQVKNKIEALIRGREFLK